MLKAGANLIVSPNVNADAIVMAVAGGAVSLPVVMTLIQSVAFYTSLVENHNGVRGTL